MKINFPKSNFDLYVDVGLSHNAPHSVNILNNKKDCFVIGIEPNPKNCNSVKSKNLGERFHLIECGIGDVESIQIKKLNMMYPDSGTSSFLKPTEILLSKGYHVENVVEVPIISLKSILDLVPWDLVSDQLFDLKSDTQGFELEVLKSCGEYISKIKSLQIESTTWGQYEQACNFDDIVKLLNPHMLMIKNEGENAWFIKK